MYSSPKTRANFGAAAILVERPFRAHQSQKMGRTFCWMCLLILLRSTKVHLFNCLVVARHSPTPDAGVSSWGRWTARIDADTALEAGGTGEGADAREETVGDDARLAASDAAVGLIRMGILPRIRYVLEVSTRRDWLDDAIG